MILDHVCISWKDRVKHIGNIVMLDQSDCSDYDYKRSHFIDQACWFNTDFKSLNYHLKCKLFTAFCSSLYGSQLWNLGCKDIDRLCNAWNKALRSFLDLPPKWLLSPLIGMLHVKAQLHKHCMHFIKSVLNSNNSIVRAVFDYATNNARLVIGHKVALLPTTYDICLNSESNNPSIN